MCIDRCTTLESVLKIKVDKSYRNMVRSSYIEKRKYEMFDKDGNYWPTDDEWNDFVEEEDTE